ncbi:argininosuccinate synthase [Johnsonella ignava ATCC 51276]|uniref:Argininosuccinate synthase n=1 Tax=Johnsonella ignava ATCC 51276 TaxID=679200 RepID=G5GGK0_9FIRM|nr:argininosuccinate synthase [Johnsonella ignava]EHI56160.1 argininosuccinate synthase [Johnsonella ignava ATCC 51276]
MKKSNDESIKKIVLAYSGGLDTSVMIPWLKENYNNAEIIAVSGDVGQEDELEGLEEKAKKTGASKCYIVDLKETFVKDYIFPCLKAGAKYEDVYLLGTSFARPALGKAIVDIAVKEGADAICHGCTGKGNDQVRFELAIKAFAPEMKVIAPWRNWELKSREDEIEYAKRHNIPLKISKETNYSKDKNIWHLSHEGLDLENPENEPEYDKILELGVTPQKAPDKECYISIGFEKGIPVSINKKKMEPVDLILELNKIGGENGIGIVDMVENRLVGMKSRGIYETPGGTILYKAHELIESITLDKDTMHYKQLIAVRFGELVYNGQWFTPLREALSAFADSASQNVNGEVKLKLYKGNIIPAGITSPTSLYSEQIASFGEDDSFNHNDSAGFISLFGLPIKIRAIQLKNKDIK